MSLQDALQSLSEAHGPGALIAAFSRVQGDVRASRRESKRTLGNLARTFLEAMRIWDEQKAAGISRTERLAGLDRSLRSAWPFVREWHYVCDRCSDLGLELFTCPGDATCGRNKLHGPHSYGEPCWCAKGAQFKAKSKPSPEDYTMAGKSKPKASGFQRMGR